MSTLPQIINSEIELKKEFPFLCEKEVFYIEEAKGLFSSGFYSYSLLAVWNAAINNLRRKVEAYGVELWSSVVKDEPGRKKFDKDGESIAERWGNVDDLVLISGAARLGLLNPLAGKSLEMINWMRNHATPAHDSDHRVGYEDAVGLILILQKNLFSDPLPVPGHSVASIFEPIKRNQLAKNEIDILIDQIHTYRNQDIRNVFGFFMDLLTKGDEPAKTNIIELFPAVWEKANEDLRKTLGVKFHTYVIDPNTDDSPDKGARTRVFELLVKLNAVNYIPDGTRAKIFRRAAEKLAEAKNSTYGWSNEESASKGLAQLGVPVPSVVFELVYQEILAVWCGNYWGRSKGFEILEPFIDSLNTDQILKVLRMFKQNKRVQEELSQRRPNDFAVSLLQRFESKLTLESHKHELIETLNFVKEL